MSRVLITGGAGFIGYHLAKQLVSGDYQVDLIDNFSRGVMDGELRALESCLNLTLLNRNLLQADAFNGLSLEYNYIYHLAAIIGVANVVKSPYAVIRDNVGMLVNVLAFAARQSKLARLIFASTSEVYSGTLEFFKLAVPTPESTPLTVASLSEPRTSYMLSKICGEALCQYADVPWTIVRPHNIYGPRMGMAHVIPQLLNRAYCADNDSLDVFSVDHRRTFCYVTDGAAMIRCVAESDACVGETLNIGNQTPEISIEQLAKTILAIAMKPLKIVPRPTTPGSPTRRSPDMTKTIALTGYTSQVGLEAGIRLTYDWYRRNIFTGEEITAN